MIGDEEEIYDDTSAEMTESTGLSAIRARFEQAKQAAEGSPAAGPKPGITPKPKVAHKFGGGPGLNICSGSVPNSFKPGSLTGKDSNENSTETGNTPQKPQVGNPRRNSKLNIPAAFLGEGSPGSPTENKPKIDPKPKPWKSDTNNNPKVNGVAPVEKIDIHALEKSLTRRPSTPSSPNETKGKTSPRGKTVDGAIPNDQSSASSVPKSPRGRGAAGPGGGINVLAMVSALGGESGGPVDFKSRLRHVEPAKKGVSSALSPSRFNEHSTNAGTDEIPWRRSLKNAKLREMSIKGRSVVTTVTRKADGKVFQRVCESSLKDESGPPDKPEKVDFEVDFGTLEQEYKEIVEKIENSGSSDQGWTEVEEVYDDCGNVMPSTRAVSIIEPMTEEEEREWEEAGFPGLPESDEFPAPPQELLQEEYDDAAVAQPNPEEEPQLDEMYEELPEEPPPLPGPKPPELNNDLPPEVPRSLPKGQVEQVNGEVVTEDKPQEKPKDPKELEKERKKREKEEKKALEQKEKELKKLQKMFKATPEILANSVGKGKVKATAKGKKKEDVAVTEGDEVEILRMTDNPTGKWLVRVVVSQKVGYVDEKNVEVDTNSILNFMTSQKTTASPAEPVIQETYDDVEGAEEEPVQEEIYEECN